MSANRVILVGCGRSGKRHAENFSRLNCNVVALYDDSRRDRALLLRDRSFPTAVLCLSLSEALSIPADVLVVAVRPGSIADTAVAAAQAHPHLSIFCEPPPSGADAIRILEAVSRLRVICDFSLPYDCDSPAKVAIALVANDGECPAPRLTVRESSILRAGHFLKSLQGKAVPILPPEAARRLIPLLKMLIKEYALQNRKYNGSQRLQNALEPL
ncbi:MAG: Gfo/Idh/MocA family oxidoreductase [Armatimonadetes bacterium]|nr:Gfo/Idh/MocA family oxidoreductase [Armatimonadota bacterium]